MEIAAHIFPGKIIAIDSIIPKIMKLTLMMRKTKCTNKFGQGLGAKPTEKVGQAYNPMSAR